MGLKQKRTTLAILYWSITNTQLCMENYPEEPVFFLTKHNLAASYNQSPQHGGYLVVESVRSNFAYLEAFLVVQF